MSGIADPAVLAFDIGGTQLRASIVREGHVLAERRVPSGVIAPEVLAQQAARLAAEMERETGLCPDRAGVGIAAMLPLPADVIDNAPNLGWHHVPFRKMLSDALGNRPVVLVNDVDAIALGEAAFGSAQHARHVCCVFVGTGVGAGIVIAGQLLTGFRGVAAEFGHIKVVPEGGRRCHCGAQGCLEAYTGGRALLERVAADLGEGRSPSLRERQTSPDFNLAVVDAAAADGEPYANGLWTEASTHLGVSLANLCTVLNPEVLVLGGGVWTRCPELRRRVHDQLAQHINPVAQVGLRVVDATLGDQAGLIGAAQMARQAL